MTTKYGDEVKLGDWITKDGEIYIITDIMDNHVEIAKIDETGEIISGPIILLDTELGNYDYHIANC